MKFLKLKVVSGFVESMDGRYITVDGTEYESTAGTSGIRIGVNLKASLNFRGKIASFKLI